MDVRPFLWLDTRRLHPSSTSEKMMAAAIVDREVEAICKLR
jgi:hypothetical protein